ncbi:hypothetical protein [Halomonas sp. KO116]|uniref:hypothetical protein n=1 Tax=Halomonas sp. KO116 TaxID=1504981 RepID=UPI0004E2A6CB|nr:hypothetical protein [Halomonas sp. KO116]AJY50637.1 hypothetical protein KO116_02160 [Halomonas sp. KO116]
MKQVYHYTNQTQKLPLILEAGHLLPRADQEGEQPLLWFSAHPFWEPTATKSRWMGGFLQQLTFAEYRNSVGCVRFALPADDTRLMPWRAASKFAGIPKRHVYAMEEVGSEQGVNPKQWFAVPSAVPLTEVRIEVLSGDKWEVVS